MNRADAYGMQNSVEVRIPYIDQNFVKLCLNTSALKKSDLNFGNFKIKKLLKKVAEKNKVPKKIIYRKKVGTPYNYKDNYFKILKSENFDYLTELLKISKTKIHKRLSLIDDSNYSRELFSFLSAEYLFKMLLEKKSPQELKEQLLSRL